MMNFAVVARMLCIPAAVGLLAGCETTNYEQPTQNVVGKVIDFDSSSGRIVTEVLYVPTVHTVLERPLIDEMVAMCKSWGWKGVYYGHGYFVGRDGLTQIWRNNNQCTNDV
ncbi:hypothetical protein [Ruegeria sp. HKCCA4707]|uniref:hypothetical protein n=1 Tax=Ruegeria sp. HKCCA4707 TaxID=2682984 RepID=UPI00148995A9|nr:hypothetical protein [Ruegeria sp. HKCCA4707]